MGSHFVDELKFALPVADHFSNYSCCWAMLEFDFGIHQSILECTSTMTSLRLILSTLGIFLSCPLILAEKPVRLDRNNLHQNRDPSGQKLPVKTAAHWQQRRASILQGMQEVMGPLPGKERRVPLKVNIEEETVIGNYVRRLIPISPNLGHGRRRISVSPGTCSLVNAKRQPCCACIPRITR
jgi:hypothetical protein